MVYHPIVMDKPFFQCFTWANFNAHVRKNC